MCKNIIFYKMECIGIITFALLTITSFIAAWNAELIILKFLYILAGLFSTVAVAVQFYIIQLKRKIMRNIMGQQNDGGGDMKNIEKGIEITGKAANYLKEYECVFNVGIVPEKCDEDCYRCWNSDFIGMVPECFRQCNCEICQKHEELCCLNKRDECKGNCIMRLA